MAFDDLTKLAGLYKKKSMKGDTYLSGIMNGKEYLVFINSGKNAPTHPDFELFVKDKEAENSSFLEKGE